LAAEILRDLGREPQQEQGHQLDLFLDQLGDRLEQASDAEQIGVAEAFAEVMDELPRAPGAGAVAICVGIDFSAISSVTRLPHQAARSMI
jgi:hypothetical protein